jgi:hypothetical protein
MQGGTLNCGQVAIRPRVFGSLRRRNLGGGGRFRACSGHVAYLSIASG